MVARPQEEPGGEDLEFKKCMNGLQRTWKFLQQQHAKTFLEMSQEEKSTERALICYLLLLVSVFPLQKQQIYAIICWADIKPELVFCFFVFSSFTAAENEVFFIKEEDTLWCFLPPTGGWGGAFWPWHCLLVIYQTMGKVSFDKWQLEYLNNLTLEPFKCNTSLKNIQRKKQNVGKDKEKWSF